VRLTSPSRSGARILPEIRDTRALLVPSNRPPGGSSRSTSTAGRTIPCSWSTGASPGISSAMHRRQGSLTISGRGSLFSVPRGTAAAGSGSSCLTTRSAGPGATVPLAGWMTTGRVIAPAADINPRGYIALPEAKDESCHVCGRRRCRWGSVRDAMPGWCGSGTAGRGCGEPSLRGVGGSPVARDVA